MSAFQGCYNGETVQSFNVTASVVSIVLSVFANFVSTSSGGGIYAYYQSSAFNVSDSSFYNCTVTGYSSGGGIYAGSSSFGIIRDLFSYDIAYNGQGFVAYILSSGTLALNDTSLNECDPTASGHQGPAFIIGGYSTELDVNNTDDKVYDFAGSFYNYLSLGIDIHYIQLIRINAMSTFEIYLGSGTPILDTGNVINNTVSYGICRSSLVTTMKNFVVYGCGIYFAGYVSNGGTINAIGCYFDVEMTSCSWQVISSCTVSVTSTIEISLHTSVMSRKCFEATNSFTNPGIISINAFILLGISFSSM